MEAEEYVDQRLIFRDDGTCVNTRSTIIFLVRTFGKIKAEQRQSLIDLARSEEPKMYSIEDMEKCIENWGLCKVDADDIDRFLNKKEV